MVLELFFLAEDNNLVSSLALRELADRNLTSISLYFEANCSFLYHAIPRSKVRLTVRRNDTSSCSEPPSLSAIPSARFHATEPPPSASPLRARACVRVRAYLARVTSCPRHPYRCSRRTRWSCTARHGRHAPVTTHRLPASSSSSSGGTTSATTTTTVMSTSRC